MIAPATRSCGRKFLIRSIGWGTAPPTSVPAIRSMGTLIGEIATRDNSHIERRALLYPVRRSRYPMNFFSTSRRVMEMGNDSDVDVDETDSHYPCDEQRNEDSEFMTDPNPGLASVISQGIKSLEQTAEDIRYKTRNDTLSQAHKKPSFRNGRAAEMDPRQLAEGQRILDVASDCLEHLATKEETQGRIRPQTHGSGDASNGLFLFGEPIVLLECEVNRNVRQAKVYWTLPYGILLDNRINQRLYQEIMVKVQRQLVDNGGAKLLAREVHTRLSYYYPPRIKLFPATDEMVQKAIEEFMM